MVMFASKAPRTLESLPTVVVAPLTPAEVKALSATNKKVRKASGVAALGQELAGIIAAAAVREGFKAGAKESLTVQTNQATGLEVLVLVGAPDAETSALEATEYYRKLGNALVAAAKRHHAETVGYLPGEFELKSPAAARAFAEGVVLGGYSFTQYKSKKAEEKKGLKSVVVLSQKAPNMAALTEGRIAAEGTVLARDLVNMPPCDCTPAYLVKTAERIAKEHKLKIDIFDKQALKKMGANSLLSVSYGSDQPPYLIRMALKPKKKSAKVIALVGKGITFDSGGLSIKPASGMEDMKIDMAGAAAVLGAMQALAQLNPKVEVRAYIPTTENMTGGSATRPGDIAKAMSGKTIEILNTDAEGRLILADALCLAEKDGCDTIVDLATLTGACMVALGNDYAGLFSDDEKLIASLNKASEEAGERLWRLPLAKEYRKLIESSVADIKNTGGRYGGAITAALFLQEFVTNKKTRWAHLDIAGPAATESEQGYIKRGGVGFGVRTLVNLVRGM
ncbi:MAG: leucyl aminopeptidase [Proteobacteria bacterium]|nr:leucyl aminopeptidase [Pseudomonadota bacterium]